MNCPLCLAYYNSHLKPKILPCKHTLCDHCLSKIYKVSSVNCPFCNAQIKCSENKIPINDQINFQEKQSITIILLGFAVGKTVFAEACKHNAKYKKIKEATFGFNFFTAKLKINATEEASIKIWDAAATLPFAVCQDRLITGDAAILLFSLIDSHSFGICEQNYQLITAVNPDLPLILIALKCDLPSSKYKVSDIQIIKFVETHPHIKCWIKASSYEYINIKESMDIIFMEAMKYKQIKHK